MKKRHCDNAILQLIALILITMITACVPVSLTVTEEIVETGFTQEQPAFTDTPAPTATESRLTVLLVQGVDADPDLFLQIQSVLEVLADESGLRLALEETLQPEMLMPNVQVVVGVGSGLNLSGLASSAPEVTFVSINDSDIVSSDNVFVIGASNIRQEQAFLAGYLAAVISSDYKVGSLFSSDVNPEIVNAYVIGAEYFCGICRPSYPPYNNFPHWDFLPPTSMMDGFQSVVESLVTYGVEVLYLDGELVSSELLSYLEGTGIKVVSDVSPESARNNWVGTVLPDYGAVLVASWENVLSGAVGEQISTPYILSDTDAGLVSEGRLRLFEEMAGDLSAGLISTQYVP